MHSLAQMKSMICDFLLPHTGLGPAGPLKGLKVQQRELEADAFERGESG